MTQAPVRKAGNIILWISVWMALAACPVAAEDRSGSPADSWSETAFKELGQGHHAEAVAMFQDALKKDPKSRNAWFGLAAAYIQLKKYDLAEKILLQLELVHPQDVAVKNNLAWMYATAENPRFRDSRKAISRARDAVFLAPGSPELWSTLSQAHYLAGDYDKAFRAAEHLMDLVPRDKLSRTQARIYAEQYNKCKRAKEAMSLLP